MDLREYLRRRREEVEAALRRCVPSEETQPSLLHQAMSYSLFAGGKRIRPILHLATVETAAGDPAACMPFACALELVHTYSLIHDDLPAMDDDELRRGRPTNHVVFGEAVAILAGDALLTEAFRLISSEKTRQGLDSKALLEASYELAHAAGSQGMVGGQAMDILCEGKGREADAASLDYIHRHKTGALIRAAIRTGGILSGAPSEQLLHLTRFGETLGLAFQIRDDLLNVEGDRQRLGKAVGTDASREKVTYPALFGLQETRERLKGLVQEALEALSSFDERAEPLREITRYVAARDS